MRRPKLLRQLGKTVIKRSSGKKGGTHEIARWILETRTARLWSQFRMPLIKKIRSGCCPCGWPYERPRRCICEERLALDKAWQDAYGSRSRAKADLDDVLLGIGHVAGVGDLEAYLEARSERRRAAAKKANAASLAAKKAKAARLKGHYEVRHGIGRKGQKIIVAVACKHCAVEWDPRKEKVYSGNNAGLIRYNRARGRVVKHLFVKHPEPGDDPRWSTNPVPFGSAAQD